MAISPLSDAIGAMLATVDLDQVPALVEVLRARGRLAELEDVLAREDLPEELLYAVLGTVVVDAKSADRVAARVENPAALTYLLDSAFSATVTATLLQTGGTAPTALAWQALAGSAPGCSSTHERCLAVTKAAREDIARRMPAAFWEQPDVAEATGAWIRGRDADCPALPDGLVLWGVADPEAASALVTANPTPANVDAVGGKSWASPALRELWVARRLADFDLVALHGTWKHLDDQHRGRLLAAAPVIADNARYRDWWYSLERPTGPRAAEDWADLALPDLLVELKRLEYQVPPCSVAAVVARRDVSTDLALQVQHASGRPAPGDELRWRTWDQDYQVAVWSRNARTVYQCPDVAVILAVATAQPAAVRSMRSDDIPTAVATLGPRVWDLPWPVFLDWSVASTVLARELAELVLADPMMLDALDTLTDPAVSHTAGQVRDAAAAALC